MIYASINRTIKTDTISNLCALTNSKNNDTYFLLSSIFPSCISCTIRRRKNAGTIIKNDSFCKESNTKELINNIFRTIVFFLPSKRVVIKQQATNRIPRLSCGPKRHQTADCSPTSISNPKLRDKNTFTPFSLANT